MNTNKAAVKAVRQYLKGIGHEISSSQGYEVVARAQGLKNKHVLAAATPKAPAEIKALFADCRTGLAEVSVLLRMQKAYGYISALVQIPMDDVIGGDLEWLNDNISEQVTGSYVGLQDMSVNPYVGELSADAGAVLFTVTASLTSYFLENCEELDDVVELIIKRAEKYGFTFDDSNALSIVNDSAAEMGIELPDAAQSIVATKVFEHFGEAQTPSVSAAVQMCCRNNVSLVLAQEPEIFGRWDWISDSRECSDTSFETEQEAAENAVRALNLEDSDNSRYIVASSDTILFGQSEKQIRYCFDRDSWTLLKAQVAFNGKFFDATPAEAQVVLGYIQDNWQDLVEQFQDSTFGEVSDELPDWR